jgi:hypothetical protein
MALMIELEPPKGGKRAEAEGDAEEVASETTAAQRAAGKALAAAVKSGDGEAIYLAFAELHAMCADGEDGEDYPESGEV